MKGSTKAENLAARIANDLANRGILDRDKSLEAMRVIQDWVQLEFDAMREKMERILS